MPRRKVKAEKQQKSKTAAPLLSSSEVLSEGQALFHKAETLINEGCYEALQLLINTSINVLPPEEAVYVHLARHMFFDARFEYQAHVESEGFLKKNVKKIQKNTNKVALFAYHYIDILIAGKNIPDDAFKKLPSAAKEVRDERGLWLQLRCLPLYLETAAARLRSQKERYQYLLDKAEPLYHQLIERKYTFAHLGFFEIQLILHKADILFKKKYYGSCFAQAMESGHYSYILLSIQTAFHIADNLRAINSAKRMYNMLLKLSDENSLSWGGAFCLGCIANLLLRGAGLTEETNVIKNKSDVAVLFERALKLSKDNPALYSQTLLYYVDALLPDILISVPYIEHIWEVIEGIHLHKQYLPYHFSLSSEEGNSVQKYTAILLFLYQVEGLSERKAKLRQFLHEISAEFDESLNRNIRKQIKQVLSQPAFNADCELDPHENDGDILSSFYAHSDDFISHEEWKFLKTGKISEMLFEKPCDYYIEAVFLYHQKEKNISAVWESAFIAFAQKSKQAACLVGCLLSEIRDISQSGQSIKPHLEILRKLFIQQAALFFIIDKETDPVFLDLYVSLLFFLVLNEELTANIESVPREMDKALMPDMLVSVKAFDKNIEIELRLILEKKLISQDVFERFVKTLKKCVEEIIKNNAREWSTDIFTYRDLREITTKYFLNHLKLFLFNEKRYPITAYYQACCLASLQPLENRTNQAVLWPVYQAAGFGLVKAKNWLIENTLLKSGKLTLYGQDCKLLQLTSITDMFGIEVDQAALLVHNGNIIEQYSPPDFFKLMLIAYAVTICTFEDICFSVEKCHVHGMQGTLEMIAKIAPSATCWDVIKQYQDKILEQKEYIRVIVKNLIYFVGKITVAMASPLQEANFTFSKTHITFISKCRGSLPDLICDDYDSCIKKTGSFFYAKLSIRQFLRDPEILELLSHQVAVHLSSGKKEIQSEFSTKELSALQSLCLLAGQKKSPEEPIIEPTGISEPGHIPDLTM
ncbi:MAG: hypothetical protein K0R12_288 [Gammaproteobacteria bacterium]|jgi:hypothetical protein|nr:hypothetical protein [Gammaproteobacteria bacterium]